MEEESEPRYVAKWFSDLVGIPPVRWTPEMEADYQTKVKRVLADRAARLERAARASEGRASEGRSAA